MQRDTKIAAVFIITVLGLVIASTYSFRLGYRTAKEIWRGPVLVVPVPKPPSATNL